MIVRSILGPVIGVVVAAFAWAIGAKYVHQTNVTPVERAMAAVRQSPVIEAVLVDHPELEATLRAAVEAGLHARGNDEVPEISRWVAEVWPQYVVPALGNADDGSLQKLAGRLREFLVYLEAHDPSPCHQLSPTSIPRFDKLDGTARSLGEHALAAYGEAYRSGRLLTPLRPRASSSEATRIIVEGGMTEPELARIERLDRQPDAERCALFGKVFGVLERLPPDRGGSVMRNVLTVAAH